MTLATQYDVAHARFTDAQQALFTIVASYRKRPSVEGTFCRTQNRKLNSFVDVTAVSAGIDISITRHMNTFFSYY